MTEINKRLHHRRAAKIDFPICATTTGMKLKPITSHHTPGPRLVR